MTFSHAEMLWGCAFLPLMWFAAARFADERRLRASRFSSSDRGEAASQPFQARASSRPAKEYDPGTRAPSNERGWKAARLANLVGFAALVVASAGPQLGTEARELPAPGTDVVVGIDASRSMWVDDLSPTRLARAQREAMDLADRVVGARFGIVTIGGDGTLTAPLSRDRRAFASIVGNVNPAMIRSPGTDLAAGLQRCLEVFDPDAPAARAVVLLSDGGHQGDVDSLREAARSAVEAGVTVHAVLLGLSSGGIVPVSETDRAPLLDEDGRAVRSVAMRAPLEMLAVSTGGRFIDAAVEPFPASALESLGFGNVGPSLETTVIRQVPIDRYRWFVAVAGFFAAIGFVLSTRVDLSRLATSPVPMRRVSRVAAIAACSLIAAAGGEEDLPERSIRGLEQRLQEHPDDLRASYNLGVAKAREDDMDGAAVAFGNVLGRLGLSTPVPTPGALSAEERSLAARCFYGRGVSLARPAEDERLTRQLPEGRSAEELAPAKRRSLWASREDFISAISLLHDLEAHDGGSSADRALQEDAAWNLEIVTRRLREARANETTPDDAVPDGPGVDDPNGSQSGATGDDPLNQDPKSDGDPNSSDGNDPGSEDPAGLGDRDPAGGNQGTVDGGDPLPLTSAGDRSRSIAEIIARFDRERRAYDLRTARASRAEAENDW